MLITIPLLLIGGYAALCLLVFVMQRSVLFPRGSDIWRDPSQAGWAFDDLTFEVQGHTTHAWYIHAPSPRGVVLFSHGNAGTIADRLESIEDFIWAECDVLIYDYGGYGRSTGSPSESRCFADIQAAWDYLVNVRNTPTDRIVLFGRSLGAGSSTWLANKVQPAGVILESAFISVLRMAREVFPFLPAGPLVRDRFDNAARVPKISAPLLFIHSRGDEIIPFHHTQTLFEIAPEPKSMIELQGGHNDGWYLSRTTYRAGLSKFMNEVLPKEPMEAGESGG